MEGNTRLTLIDLRVILLAQADKYQQISIAAVDTAKNEKSRFEIAKTIGIVQGYLESIKELDKMLEAQNV